MKPDPHRPTFSNAVDEMRDEQAPPVEWPLLLIVGATCLILGALVTMIAYEIGKCI